jgi:hypothetical protein
MIAGAALVIAGANSADPLVLVGVVLIMLGLVGAVRGRRGEA